MVTGAPGRSRWIAVVVLSATFLAGGTLGVAASRLLADEQQAQRGDTRPGERRGERGPRPSFFDQLGLTAGQKAAVDSIMEKQTRDMNAFWKTHNAEVRGIVDSARVQIDRLLTEEQRQKYLKFRERRQREHSQSNRERPGPPPGDSSRRPISYMEPQYL